MTGDALLQAILEALARQEARFERLVQALERTHGPRDAADQAVLLTIAETVGDQRWTSNQLLDHAAITPALQEALVGADIVTARDLGALCRRVHGSPRAGIRLERAGESRLGMRWRVAVDATL